MQVGWVNKLYFTDDAEGLPAKFRHNSCIQINIIILPINLLILLLLVLLLAAEIDVRVTSACSVILNLPTPEQLPPEAMQD